MLRSSTGNESIVSSPRVSVIIPTYRRWGFLCDAIESVFSQTVGCWEIVVVNDAGGPPDGRAVELLKDPRIRYVEHAANQGHGSARNTGVACCSGEYVAYLDDDDIYYPHHLETIIGPMAAHGWDVAYTDAYQGNYKFENGAYRLMGRELKHRRDFSVSRMWRANTIPTIAIVHRRVCLNRTGGFDPALPVLEDWDLWLRLSRQYEFHHIPEVTAEYRVRTDRTNTTQLNSQDIWLETRCRIYRKYLHDSDVLRDPHTMKLLRKGISHLVRRNSAWVLQKLDEPLNRPVMQDMMKGVLALDLFRIFLRNPREFLHMRGVMRSA